MVRYENYEKWDMVEVFIESNKVVEHASNLYFNRYPERRQPNPGLFKILVNNLKVFGQFNRNRPRTYNTPNAERDAINVLAAVSANPRTSLREIEMQVGVPKSNVRRLLKKHKYRAYKVRLVQHLYLDDRNKRLRFCNWYLSKCAVNPLFYNGIIWTDEARITSDGIFNRSIHYHWSSSNENVIHERRHQGRFGLNVFCGIKGNRLFYSFYENTLTAARYIDLLNANLFEFMEEFTLQERRNTWYQLDGAPAHNSGQVRNFLNLHFQNKWIGIRGFRNWPARSPDLTPLDFFIWGYLKDQIYRNPINNLEELRQRTINAFNNISPVRIGNAIRGVRKRCELCIQANGAQFEHLLK